jgi:nucleoside-diphosphate-sugar epimerase
MTAKPLTLAITGANGNLGRKLIAAFAPQDWCGTILAIDRVLPEPGFGTAKAQAVTGDLTDRGDTAWRQAIEQADAIIHLAAQVPYPEATWTDSAASFDMTINVVAAARAGRPRRLVFATSNHVMGRYKDLPEAETAGSLRPDTPPKVGTLWDSGNGVQDSTAYATAKLMGERLCVMEAEQGGLTAVALRIGWCQPGENHPRTITGTGTPEQSADALDETGQRALRWFRNMWLSNRDLVGVVQGAVLADATGWPAPGIVVNAMSANAGAPWDLGPTEALLGYRPKDDVWQVLGGTA